LGMIVLELQSAIQTLFNLDCNHNKIKDRVQYRGSVPVQKPFVSFECTGFVQLVIYNSELETNDREINKYTYTQLTCKPRFRHNWYTLISHDRIRVYLSKAY
jgi:hypothetical protein